MKIIGQTTPLDEIRARNAGDWKYDADGISVAMAPLSDDDALCLFIHELVEARLCQKAGITDEQVTKWDEEHIESEEPGEASGAPYRAQHARALEIERHLADILGVSWHDYEARLHALFK